MYEDFFKKISFRLLEMKSFERATIFSIASTAKKEAKPYLTPMRITQDFILSGCVVFSQEQILDLLKKIDGKIDFVLADAEKKILSCSAEPDYTLIKTNERDDSKTISNISREYLLRTKVYEFKPNDLTVNAAWSFLSQRLDSISNSRVIIIGAGNIGSKLALKLAECGADVKISRRNTAKAGFITKGLNLIKPENTGSKISISSDIISDASDANVLIGTSDGVPVINKKLVQKLKPDCLIVDLGKNTLTRGAVDQAFKSSMSLYRTDVTPALEAFVYELLRTREILKYTCGRKDMGFFNIVGGGFFGSAGDVVVDCITRPTQIFGVAKGNGVMKQVLDTSDLANIKWLKKRLGISGSS